MADQPSKPSPSLDISKKFTKEHWALFTESAEGEKPIDSQGVFVAAAGGLMRAWKTEDDAVRFPLACLLALRSAWRLVKEWDADEANARSAKQG